jgi:predicted lipase
MSEQPKWTSPEETPLSKKGAYATSGLGPDKLNWDVEFTGPVDPTARYFTDADADAARRNFREAAALANATSYAAEIQNFKVKNKNEKRAIEKLRKRLSHQSLSSFRKKHLRKLLNEKKFKRDCLKMNLLELEETFNTFA